LAASAQGGRGKEKNLIAAKNPILPSEGAAEGGRRNSRFPDPFPNSAEKITVFFFRNQDAQNNASRLAAQM
jgi:hypothetical protein